MPSTIDFGGDADGKFDPAEKAAADWFVRRDRGLTPAEEEEFNCWLRADRRYAEIYREIEITRSMLRRLAESPRWAPAPNRRRMLLWIPVLLVAAAIVAACILRRQADNRRRMFSEIATTDV